MSAGQSPVRVLVVTPQYLPDLGGIEQHVHATATRIARRGDIALTVLATDRTGTRPVLADGGGFTVRRVRAYPRHRDYYLAPGLGRVIRDGHFDLVHCQGIHTAVPVLAMRAARQAGLPYLVSLHTGGHSSGLRNRLRTAQWRALGPWLRGAAAVVAVSRSERRLFEYASRIEPARIREIRNGGDLGSAGDLGHGGDLESAGDLGHGGDLESAGDLGHGGDVESAGDVGHGGDLGSAGDLSAVARVPGQIVSSGRLERYKGHHRVIEALPLVRRVIPGATVRILGSGPYEGALRKRVRALGLEQAVSIDYIEPGQRGAMAAALAGATVFAALSDYEGHPVAVMEALTLGLPVVGLCTPGLADLAEDGLIQGLPADAGPAEVAAALVTALREPAPVVPPIGPPTVPPAGPLGSLPSWDDTAAALADLYLELCGRETGVEVRTG